jgi:hypothetical protein
VSFRAAAAKNPEFLFFLEARIVGRDTSSHRQTGIGYRRRAFALDLVTQVVESLFTKLFAGIRSYA